MTNNLHPEASASAQCATCESADTNERPRCNAHANLPDLSSSPENDEKTNLISREHKGPPEAGGDLPGPAALESVGNSAHQVTAATCPAPESQPGAFSQIGMAGRLTSTAAPFLNPVLDVRYYLATRRPVAHYRDERELFIALPDELRLEVESQLDAFDTVAVLIKARLSVRSACNKTLTIWGNRWKLKTFRANYDLWRKTGDWVALVNLSKAGARWQNRAYGLPESFLKFCAVRFGKFGRADGKSQAILSIKRQWRTGRNLRGAPEPIPGYEAGWDDRNREVCPRGWHKSNILSQVKDAALFNAAIQTLMHEGVAAAKALLPQHLGTRKGLRFLELVTFDDVRMDWLVFDPETGQPCELWLLVARDQATAMVLGFVMHLSNVRPDGTASHLGLKEMKQLAAWILERYPLPPYASTWKVERGTATLSEGSKLALAEMLPNNIRISYTGMIGGKSPAGYKEKAKGNSRGKASHESHNRLFHTQSCHLAGQTGAHWDIRPADLGARSAECVEIWKMRNNLPEHLRGREKYPLLTLGEAREQLFQICIDQNFRKDHALEGFDEVLEWIDPADNKIKPRDTIPQPLPPGARIIKRLEMPVERAIKLMAPYAGQWAKVSPDIVIAFLSHTIRRISNKQIRPSGEIAFDHDGSSLIFAPPEGVLMGGRTSALAAEKTLLGYHNPDDPSFLHVTNGAGSILGTWYRRRRLRNDEPELFQQAMRYTANALKAAQDYASSLAADERARLDDIRLHNAELKRGNEFVEVGANPTLGSTTVSSHVARALSSTRTHSRRIAQTQQTDAALADAIDSL